MDAQSILAIIALLGVLGLLYLLIKKIDEVGDLKIKLKIEGESREATEYSYQEEIDGLYKTVRGLELDKMKLNDQLKEVMVDNSFDFTS